MGHISLGIEELSRAQIEHLIETSQQFVEVNERAVKKVPSLRGRTVINLFLEPSTRTRSSFEIAGKRLSADVINVTGKSSTSVTKGETLRDTVLTLQSMAPDVVVIRHEASGSAHFVSRYLNKTSVINAGDGMHEHPTQALLDALTIKQRLGRLDGLTLTLVGDSLRSRVARSNIFLHKKFGNTVRVVGPSTLAIPEFEELGVEVHYDMDEALAGADVVMSLRTKHEYLSDLYLPNLDEFTKRYFINDEVLDRHCPNCIVLSPGPFIRGVEISSSVVDGPRSCISEQVTNGVAVRMATLFMLASGAATKGEEGQQAEEEGGKQEIAASKDGEVADGKEDSSQEVYGRVAQG